MDDGPPKPYRKKHLFRRYNLLVGANHPNLVATLCSDHLGSGKWSSIAHECSLLSTAQFRKVWMYRAYLGEIYKFQTLDFTYFNPWSAWCAEPNWWSLNHGSQSSREFTYPNHSKTLKTQSLMPKSEVNHTKYWLYYILDPQNIFIIWIRLVKTTYKLNKPM